MDLNLKGKTALVTGASIGIGRGIALALAREGARLAIVARRANLLEELAGEIVAAGGAKPVLVVEDLVQEGAPARIAKAALDGLGSVDILINNAGGSRPFKIDATEEQWQEAMTLNFTRQRQLTHALLDQMTKGNGAGSSTSPASRSPRASTAPSAPRRRSTPGPRASRARSASTASPSTRIPPGRIDSEQIRRNYTPEYRQWQADNEIPVGRYGEPEDVAGLVCFLASPLAGYITGTVIPVDGGLRRYQF